MNEINKKLLLCRRALLVDYRGAFALLIPCVVRESLQTAFADSLTFLDHRPLDLLRCACIEFLVRPKFTQQEHPNFVGVTLLVDWEGLEPSTCRLRAGCSTN